MLYFIWPKLEEIEDNRLLPLGVYTWHVSTGLLNIYLPFHRQGVGSTFFIFGLCTSIDMSFSTAKSVSIGNCKTFSSSKSSLFSTLLGTFSQVFPVVTNF